jgi:hypothetical protein
MLHSWTPVFIGALQWCDAMALNNDGKRKGNPERLEPSNRGIQ